MQPGLKQIKNYRNNWTEHTGFEVISATTITNHEKKEVWVDL